MNETTLRELKIVVERAVRPIRGSRSRKRRMREELLAHLLDAWEQEAATSRDEEAALDAAKKRFGDPGGLSVQLQHTVPRWDRVYGLLDEFCGQDGSTLRVVRNHVAFTSLAFAVILLLMTPVLVIRGKPEIGLILHVPMVTAIVGAAFTSAFVVLADRIGRALYGRSPERSVRLALFYGLISLPIFPALAFLAYWALSWDLTASLIHLRFACCFAPAAPVAFFLMARPMAEETLYEEEWASLRIED